MNLRSLQKSLSFHFSQHILIRYQYLLKNRYITHKSILKDLEALVSQQTQHGLTLSIQIYSRHLVTIWVVELGKKPNKQKRNFNKRYWDRYKMSAVCSEVGNAIAEAGLLQAHHETTKFLGKTNNAGENRRQKVKKKTKQLMD